MCVLYILPSSFGALMCQELALASVALAVVDTTHFCGFGRQPLRSSATAACPLVFIAATC